VRRARGDCTRSWGHIAFGTTPLDSDVVKAELDTRGLTA